MKLTLTALALASLLHAGPPAITELRPRGAQSGRPFTLTLVGKGLGQGPTVISTLPATFTLLGPETQAADKNGMAENYASFLVEPTSEWRTGVYPIRIRAGNGLSNILLFSVGAFPEITEEESRPGSAPNQNDSIETAQPIPSTPVTLNGTLHGPERDVYRMQAKAGEKRVFEVDARRCGSAIDPVIRVLDGSGKLIARSDDGPLLNLDARVQVAFPKDGFYYIEIHDARFSTQAQNFYRLKSGSYEVVDDIFPLGGRRGETVQVSLSGHSVAADLSSAKSPLVFVGLPDSPSLPLPFAVGEYPEVTEPVAKAVKAPVTINGRIAKPAEVDRYELEVAPGDELIVELQAREIGTSKLTGLITVYDEKGNRLESAGDGPLPVDSFAVQATSRTLGDPSLRLRVPDGVHRLTMTVEDLAQRGGPLFGYRLIAYPAPFNLKATIDTPYLNIPAGGTAVATIEVERQGYAGPIRIDAKGLPEGVSVAGGDIPAEDGPNRKIGRREAVLTFTAPTAVDLATSEITLLVSTPDGKYTKKAAGIGYSIDVGGATEQGVVDRQRPLTGGWLGQDLPVAVTDPTSATLSVKVERTEKKEAGYEYLVRWRWTVRNPMYHAPATVEVDVPNFNDLRVIEMQVDKKDDTTGTFLITSTKNTLPARYNLLVSGRLMADGSRQEIYAPIVTFDLPALEAEEKAPNASASAAR